MEGTRYMISDAASLVNVESHVLRYWEEELELDIPRNEMGHRYYTDDNLREFLRIKEWKEQGYQLKAIRMLVQEERTKTMAGTRNAANQLVSGDTIHKEDGVSDAAKNTIKMEQFQTIMTSIVRNALEDNNQALGKEVGYQVGDKVIKEMNYLMRVQDEAEEERFRKLDAALRAHGKGRKIKADKPAKAGRFAKKEKKLNPNMGI